ncbi:MAG: hypothetical protein CSA35_05980 [Dethiosulfovibrio peptidovorans]|nr:MAG: hypothetical protein CSA35_05980 [Dethiosulfovibrio peptidovorans]
MRKIVFLALIMVFLTSSLYAGIKDKLDNWEEKSGWPFDVSDKEISMGYLKDATTTDLSDADLDFVKSIGERFLEDLAIWKAAQNDINLKSHQKFAALDRQIRNYNEARKQIAEYMEYDFLLPLQKIKLISYKDGSFAIAKGTDGKYVRELGEAYINKLQRYAKQVAPFFGGKDDKMGKSIIDQVALVVKANEYSKDIIRKSQEEKKIENERKQGEMAKTEKYDPKKVSVKFSDEFIGEIKREYKKASKTVDGKILDISPVQYKEYMDYTGGALNLEECIAKKCTYKEKYDVQGVLLVKNDGKYIKYTFSSVKSINHVHNGTAYSNPYTSFYTKVVKKCEVQAENVANEYRK